MSSNETEDGAARFATILRHDAVRGAADRLLSEGEDPSTGGLLRLASALCAAAGDRARSRILRAELEGYEATGVPVPARRRVQGYASPFRVRAIGLLDPEEIFLANREKFAQVSLTIGQPVSELETALDQIREGGVLALRVPASEISGEAAGTDPDTEVHIYVLPREIERVVEAARTLVVDALVARVVEGALGPEAMFRLSPPTDPAISLSEIRIDEDDEAELEELEAEEDED
jgi:hypothetical protein